VPSSSRRPSSALRPRSRGALLVVDRVDVERSAQALEPGAVGPSALCDALEARGYLCTLGVGLDAVTRIESSTEAVIVVLASLAHHGVELVKRARSLFADLPLLVIGSNEEELDACALAGAYCLREPADVDTLSEILQERRAPDAPSAPQIDVDRDMESGVASKRLVARSAAMRLVARAIERSAPSRTTVLITGESGTGKELVAEAIHAHSPRRTRPFVRLHCAALADNLLESELFGHERGAFTGAVARREGRFELADTGTLFLDEIGEIGPITQIKLLRVLQQRAFERVGGTQTVKVDVRILAATNRDLREEVRLGRFREDLFYRLDVINIDVPPLRARPEDVVPLAQHFLGRFAAENGKRVRGFTPSAMRRLESYPWPGNVRELENTVERAVVLAEGALIDEGQLPAPGMDAFRGSVHVPGMTLDDIERWAILTALDAAGGSTAGAAKLLGISVRKVQYRLQAYGRLTKRMVSTRESRPPPAPSDAGASGDRGPGLDPAD
jgi:two-component system response regulator HydG